MLCLVWSAAVLQHDYESYSALYWWGQLNTSFIVIALLHDTKRVESDIKN